jgi:hypothetical protein
MTSFIEIPQLTYNGRECEPLYVNVADIISFEKTYDNGTEFKVRDLGSDGVARFKSYLPIGLFLDLFGELARFPGVRSWSDGTKNGYLEPAKERSRAAAEAERDANNGKFWGY